MPKYLLKSGRIIDPATDTDFFGDVFIAHGLVQKIGFNFNPEQGTEIIDCTGKLITPGLIDMHVHFRTPGQNHKEILESGSLAALAGGFTTVVAMANTSPAIDSAEKLRNILLLAENKAFCHYYQVGAATLDLAGEVITDIPALKRAGAIAISDDGKAIQEEAILGEVLKRCKNEQIPFLVHCEADGYNPDSVYPEYAYLEIVLSLAQKLKAPLHIQHVSCARSLSLIRQAKDCGVEVTCETAPHYFSLVSEYVKKIGTNAKMNPPLRTDSDRTMVISRLSDKPATIEVIATDHAPHAKAEKEIDFDKAPNGIIGLETAVPVCFSYLNNNLLVPDIIAKLTINPAKILGLKNQGRLVEGLPADITVIDPKLEKVVEADKFYSLSRNCPWNGHTLTSWPVMTIFNGKIAMKDGKILL